MMIPLISDSTREMLCQDQATVTDTWDRDKVVKGLLQFGCLSYDLSRLPE